MLVPRACVINRGNHSVESSETSYIRFSGERHHGFTEDPGEADVEGRVWYARTPRR